MFKHLPNILTVVRFLLIPVIVLFALNNNYIAAIVVLTISGITDILDGYIARRFNLISDFGKLMDPFADKATQLTILVVLSIKGIIPFWIMLVVLLKEVLMIAGASFLYGKDVVVYSKWYGKLATVLFYVAIVFSLLAKQFNLIDFWSKFDFLLYCLALIATVFSLIMYVKDLYQKGFIDKQDLKKEVTIDKKEKKKSSSK